MPFVAVSAHKMLGHVAALKLATGLLEDQALPAERRAELLALVRRSLDNLDVGLRELITVPREMHTDNADETS